MSRIFTICLFFLSFTLLGQSNFVEATITKLNGETVAGKIDYREWIHTPKEIHFQSSIEPENIDIFDASELQGFRINHNGEEYKRAIVGINKEPIDENRLVRFESDEALQQPLKLDIDTVFLLTLVKGRVNLYTLYDEGKQHFFIQKNRGRIEELVYRVVLVKNRLQTGIASLPERPQTDFFSIVHKVFEDYKRQLVEAMPDCPGIQSSINKVTYSLQLKDLVQDYNECTGTLTYIKPKDKAKSALYGFVGVSQPLFAFKDGALQNPRNLSPALAPAFGLGLEVGIIRSLDKLSLGLEVNYVKARGETTTTSIVGLDEIQLNSQYNFDIQGFRLNGLLKYVLFNDTWKPYLRAGLGVSSYAVADYTRQITKSDPTSNPTIFNGKLIDSELHGIIGVGMKYNHFFLESRFESGNDINKTTGEDLKMRRLSVFAGYALPLSK